ncbi:MAG: flagellar filament capping protein FliD [Leptospiraceae bacterium]|nr:flagellar filament capping protein FliD [Leptospiraceae bacterium]
MPAPFATPSASGIDVPKVIKQLIEIEREPLRRLEEDNRRNEIRIQAWEELRTKTKKLVDTSREIYSFAGPFAIRKIVSDDEGSITGIASPNAEEGSQRIHVHQLAKAHKIRSKEISKSEVLPKGKFQILIDGKETEIQFAGGSIEDLEKAIRQQSGKNVSFELSKVQTSDQKVVLVLTSKVMGSKGKIQFKDPDGILKQIEWIGPKGKKEEIQEILTLQKENLSPQTEEIQIKDNTVFFENTNHFSLDVALKNVLEVSFSFEATIEEPKEEVRPTIHVDPVIKKEIEGIEITLPQIERVRITEPMQPQTYQEIGSVKIFYVSQGMMKEQKIPLQKNQKEYTLKLSDQDEGVEITKIEISKNYKGKGQIGKFQYKTQKEKEIVFEPLHVIEPPQDAVLQVNGVELRRTQNENLVDILPGVSLNLHKTTTREVEIRVEHDVSKIKEKIKEWVNAYNELITFIRDNDQFQKQEDFQIQRSANPNEKIEDGLRKLEDASGIFAGDATVRRLVSLLGSIVSSAYPSRTNPAFRTLPQIGISTGKPGSSWQDVKRGLLVIDEETLDTALKNHPDSVKELFSSDRNEDAIVDNGVAYKTYEELSPYVKMAGGIITSRIELLKEQIKTNEKIIYNKELSIMRKEDMLKSKFGNMEGTIQNMKNTQKFLENRLKTQD